MLKLQVKTRKMKPDRLDRPARVPAGVLYGEAIDRKAMNGKEFGR